MNIFNEDLVGVKNDKINLLLNKPIYVGQAILDLSKTIMYEFDYHFIEKKYGVNASLNFTDTDSLCYTIFTDCIYKDMFVNGCRFDLSNYTEDHPAYDPINKKNPGCFKDETGGVPISEVVALRSKSYSFTYANKEKQVAKGVARSTIKNFYVMKCTKNVNLTRLIKCARCILLEVIITKCTSKPSIN